MQVTRGTLDIPNDPTPWMIARPNDSKEYCVLWLQGWSSTIAKHEERIVWFAEQTGLTFAILDYAGHGSHPIPLEKTTRQQQFTEVVAAYDALKADGYKNIIVAGTSFGGYMSALLTAERSPYAVILRVPAIYKDEEFTLAQSERQGYLDEAYQKLKPTISASDNFAALHAIRDFGGSVYVIEQEIDSVIPKNIPLAYFSVAKRGNYLVVPATDHSPAMMDNPAKHFRYIEAAILSSLKLIRLEATLT